MADVEPAVEVMLHDDWELNGDGTGCMQQLMLDPVERVLSICERFGARYTLFAEVGQQLAMFRSKYPEQRELAGRWERAVVDAVSRGHDVQLHLHPQWLGASYDGQRWHLKYECWNTGRLAYDDLFALLRDGRDYLEDVIRPHVPGYRICAFRAGGWMCQPSSNLSRALCALGINADVTVMKGRYKDYGSHGTVDFREAPSAFLPWRAAEADFASESRDGEGILEIPTYSEFVHLPVPLFLVLSNPRSAWHYLQVARRWRRRRASIEYSPKSATSPSTSNGHRGWLGRVFRPRPIYASFNYMHHATIEKMVQRLHRKARERGLASVPMVMLAHSKSFYSYTNFEKLLERLSRLEYVRFATTLQVVSRLEAAAA